jgi:hypothetical protein
MNGTSGSLSKDSFKGIQSMGKATQSPANLHEWYRAEQFRAFLAQQHCHFLCPPQSYHSQDLTCEMNK